MKVNMWAAAAIAGGLALAAANSGPAVAADYVTDAAEVVAKTDWKTMETVTVIMGEIGKKLLYKPADLTFEKGRPYRLRIVNQGKKKHYFTAPEFFKAVASRKVQSDNDGEVKAPYFLAFELMPKGGQLDFYFVPVKAGTYEVVCTIDDHKERGMHGTLTVR